MEIKIRDHTFDLLPQKAIFWKEQKMLIIGDPHLGKITHFRKAGIALPSIASEDNLRRLASLIDIHRPTQVLFLGDLFHHRYNREWESFIALRKNYGTIAFSMVIGNHDILPSDVYASASISVANVLLESSFLFMHKPSTDAVSSHFVFCGHIHPVYCLKSSAKQQLKLPCFVLEERQMILPSFGIFTGGYPMKRILGRRIYIIADESVYEV